MIRKLFDDSHYNYNVLVQKILITCNHQFSLKHAYGNQEKLERNHYFYKKSDLPKFSRDLLFIEFTRNIEVFRIFGNLLISID